MSDETNEPATVPESAADPAPADDATPPEPSAAPPPDPASAPAEPPTPPAAAPEPTLATEPAPEADDDWSDPNRGREAKRKANQEAKRLRSEIDTLKAQLALRVDPEESKAAIALVEAESARTVARIRYGHQYNLPDGIAERLKGETPEEIEADAKALAVHFAPSPGLGRGGLDPTDEPEKADPRKLAANIPRFH